MNKKSDTGPNIAELYTPEELLVGAESFLSFSEPQMMRAAVLEAITALEAYVQDRIFAVLDEKLDSLLVKWLKHKTQMDFDSRLSVLTPVALNQSVDKKSRLWNDYKRAKDIRDNVTHSGSKVSPEDARFVVKTVYDWLAFLGGTAEVELSLMSFKKYIESAKIRIEREEEAINLVQQYFSLAKAAVTTNEVSLPGLNDTRVDRCQIPH